MTFAGGTLDELLDRIAAKEPAPGGGTAAAWSAATAAALVEMAAAFAIARPLQRAQMTELRDRGATLRAHLMELAEQDMQSYRPVLEALALAPDDPRRTSQLQTALSAAAEVPLAIAASASEVAGLAAAAAAAGSPQLLGDATAGATLAEAAARAAVRLVEINLAHRPGDPRLREAAELARRAWSAREQTLARGQ